MAAAGNAATGILRQVVSLEEGEQLKGLTQLRTNLETSEFGFLEAVSGEEFTAGLRRVLDRKSPKFPTVEQQLVAIVDEFGKKFEPISDLLPGLVQLRAELLRKGLVRERLDAGAASDWRSHDHNSQQQQHQAGEAGGGQDAEEFLTEASETVKLFGEVARQFRASDAGATAEAKREALITLAMNLDRYQEQLEIWTNLLLSEEAQGGNFDEYRRRAAELDAKIAAALDQYRALRI